MSNAKRDSQTPTAPIAAGVTSLEDYMHVIRMRGETDVAADIERQAPRSDERPTVRPCK